MVSNLFCPSISYFFLQLSYTNYSFERFEEALEYANKAIFYGEKLKIANILKPLQDVGMGYVALGQSSSTLSGGEAQRIKLASFLNKGYSKNKTLFLFDEPTTGLHMHDVRKLIKSFNALVDMGHSLIVIEHNTNLIKQANHIIDLGPSGGNNGGYVIATGSPKDVNENKNSSLFKLLA